MWVAMGLFYQMIPKKLTILYALVSRSHICEIEQEPHLWNWAGATFVKLSRSHICEIEQEPHLWNLPKSRLDWNWYLFSLLSAKLRVVKRLWSYHSDGLMTLCEKYALLCVYSDICHQHFMLHRAINYFIERFGYSLACSVINAVIINAVKHQKVTKTHSNVIDSSMRHKMSVAYVRIYTQQSIFFHELSLDHQNYNFEAFSQLSMLLIADKRTTNSCQAWILVNFTNVAPAHSSIQYCQIFFVSFDRREIQLPTCMNISWK